MQNSGAGICSPPIVLAYEIMTSQVLGGYVVWKTRVPNGKPANIHAALLAYTDVFLKGAQSNCSYSSIVIRYIREIRWLFNAKLLSAIKYQ